MQLILKLSKRFEKKMKSALKGLNITIVEYEILKFSDEISRKTNFLVTQARVSRAANLNKMTVSKSAVSLRKKELIIIKVDEEDSRKRALHLTALGEKVLLSADMKIKHLSKETFSVLNVKQRSAFRQLAQLCLDDD
jgi:DNA-binding MarR family transcriptional regulator